MPLSGRNVLIVEDEYFLADDLATIVKNKRGNVLGPYRDTSSVDCSLHEIDLALLDVNLGHKECVYGLAKKLKKAMIPFMFTTGYNKDYIDKDFRDVPILIKPYLERDLIANLLQLEAEYY